MTGLGFVISVTVAVRLMCFIPACRSLIWSVCGVLCFLVGFFWFM